MTTSAYLSGTAHDIYEAIRADPIVSPHGHCDPRWFSQNHRFADPAALFVIPDHYLFRMLYSQGIALERLGIGQSAEERDARAIFQLFADHWHLFLGTPSRIWLDHSLRHVFGIDDPLSSASAGAIFDQIETALARPEFRPRALYERFNIEVLATTDAATDDLAAHRAIAQSGWGGRVIPTFRPDAVLNPEHDGFAAGARAMITGHGGDPGRYDDYLAALRARRAGFIALGATASDHAIEAPATHWLDPAGIGAFYARAMKGDLTGPEAQVFYGHMLVEMAQMSLDDGLVMQIHAGSRRNTNAQIYRRFGPDMGADMPLATDWVRGLEPLLNRVGNDPRFTLIAFTLDETSYARELAPMAGHWPCLKIGPPWWFHDSHAGIARYFDQVVETAGYWNLAGFNDDTRAFLSIPARHDVWRQGVALHLAGQVGRGYFAPSDATRIAKELSTGLARHSYRLTV